MRLSPFQRMLFDDLRAGVWYDVYWNQGTGGEVLPDWFYRQQTQAWSTIGLMIERGALARRTVQGFPQVMKIQISAETPGLGA